MAAAAMAQKKGQRRRRLTPKIAGSVIPKTGGCTTGTGQALELGVAGLEEDGQSGRACATFAMEATGEDEVTDAAR